MSTSHCVQSFGILSNYRLSSCPSPLPTSSVVLISSFGEGCKGGAGKMSIEKSDSVERKFPQANRSLRCGFVAFASLTSIFNSRHTTRQQLKMFLPTHLYIYVGPVERPLPAANRQYRISTALSFLIRLSLWSGFGSMEPGQRRVRTQLRCYHPFWQSCLCLGKITQRILPPL
jgi:hypothetical protein